MDLPDWVVPYSMASEFLVEAVRGVAEGDWDAPGLGEWTIKELVAHANRGHTTVVDYLTNPQQAQAPDSEYFSEAAVAQRARESVAALGDDAVGAVRSAADTALGLLADTSGDSPISTPAGTMPISRYLPSRTAELTIHGLDVVRACSSNLEPPAQAVAESLGFVTYLASRKAGLPVLLALSGRGALEDGFSVY